MVEMVVDDGRMMVVEMVVDDGGDLVENKIVVKEGGKGKFWRESCESGS